MSYSLRARIRPALLLLAPLLAILAGRIATHSDIAARHPRIAALLFLWIAADSLALTLIAKAPHNRPQLRALLGAIATGCIVATLGAAAPVRTALFDMRAVVLAMGLTVTAYAGWSCWRAVCVFRQTRSVTCAAQEILPEPIVRFAGHELAMIRLALFNWGAAPDMPAGASAFAYHRILNPMIGALMVLQLIEIGVVHLLVSHWSATAAWILFALGVWGVLFIAALMKAFRLFPVLLDESSVRVRAGTMVDCLVPLPLIAGIETVISHQEIQRRNVLNAAILAHPNVVLRLARPLEYRGLFGKSRMVEQVAFRLDEPTPFIVALRERI